MRYVGDKIYRLYDGSRKKNKNFSCAQGSVTMPDIIETSVILLPNLSEEISSDNKFEKFPDSNDETPTMQIVSTKQNKEKNQPRVRTRSQPERNTKPPKFGDEIYCKERESRENTTAERKLLLLLRMT
jgi:hypothetical protein